MKTDMNVKINSLLNIVCKKKTLALKMQNHKKQKISTFELLTLKKCGSQLRTTIVLPAGLDLRNVSLQILPEMENAADKT